MSDLPPAETPSLHSHKRQRVWQIVLPVVVTALVVVAGAILAVSGQGGSTRAWADVAIIWLVAPLMLFGLLAFFLLAVAIWGVVKLTRITPRYTGRTQELAGRIENGTRRAADAAVKPILWIHQAGAVIDDLLKKI